MRRVLATLLCIVLWRGTAWADVPKGPTVEEMAAQMLMVGFRGTEADAASAIARHIRAGRVGNVVIFELDQALGAGKDRNIVSPQQLKALIKDLKAAMPEAAQLPLWVAVDQEGGRVQRLRPARGFVADWPSAQTLGRGDVAETRTVAERMGEELAALGIDMDFAPVADVNVDPDSPAIGRLERSFGSDPDNVARHAIAFGEGMSRAGVVPCLKHFPGHGSAAGDTHAGTTDVTRTWTEMELYPYRAAFAAGWPGAVMIAHVFHADLDSERPASLSVRITWGLLRGVLGWRGVVVTDDLQMGALTQRYSTEQCILMAVQAGVDILVFSGNAKDAVPDSDFPKVIHDILVRLVREGKISEGRLYESWLRIAEMKARRR